jgi:hypothetical protein
MMMLACLGLSLAPPANRGAHLFLILVVMFISGIHTVVFGHERYHLPLVPLLLLYAAVGVGAHSWQRLREGMRTATPPLLACIGLLAIWGYEVFITDVQQIKRLLQALLS